MVDFIRAAVSNALNNGMLDPIEATDPPTRTKTITFRDHDGLAAETAPVRGSLTGAQWAREVALRYAAHLSKGSDEAQKEEVPTPRLEEPCPPEERFSHLPVDELEAAKGLRCDACGSSDLYAEFVYVTVELWEEEVDKLDAQGRTVVLISGVERRQTQCGRLSLRTMKSIARDEPMGAWETTILEDMSTEGLQPGILDVRRVLGDTRTEPLYGRLGCASCGQFREDAVLDLLGGTPSD